MNYWEKNRQDARGAKEVADAAEAVVEMIDQTCGEMIRHHPAVARLRNAIGRPIEPNEMVTRIYETMKWMRSPEGRAELARWKNGKRV